MKLDFKKNVKRNMVANAASSGLRLLFPFLNRTLFLWLLGPAYLGLNGLFGSILGVLMLAELGFGTAIVCSMYKPVADDDRELICAYLKFYRTVYRWVGSVIFVAGLCLMPFLDRLVCGNIPPDVDLHVLYLIHLVNTAASYFLFAYRGSVLNAYHRGDVAVNIGTAVSIAQYASVFLILFLTRNYYHYVLVTVAFTVIKNILIVMASRKLFPDIEPRGELQLVLRRRVLSDVRSIFLHKVGGVIVYSIDNIVISAFLGLVAVAAYGNYYYVVTAVTGLVAVIYGSVAAGFGNKIQTESKASNFKLFMKLSRLSQVSIAFCAAMMAALYQPFIQLWTKAEPSLCRHWLTPALMVAYFYINQSRHMLLSFKSAAGIWHQDQYKPIAAGALNLALNISFVIFLPEAWKLDGVIASTVIAYLIVEIPWETRVVFSSYFTKNEAKVYARFHLRFAFLTAALCAAAWGAAKTVGLGGWPGLAAKGAVASVATIVILFAVFRQDVVRLVGRISGDRWKSSL